MKQNITLSLEKDLIKKAKILAAKKDMSVTKLLSEELTKVISEDDEYEVAKKRALTVLKKGLPLGGRLNNRREELHERR